MTNASRVLLLLPVVALAIAAPFVLAARDPLEDARRHFASLTPAQRKSIEQSREAYDKLSSFDQFELRQLADALDKLPTAERTDLEATMGRLQAWVAAFRDPLRAQFDKGMNTERLDILKTQLDAWKIDHRTIVAEVRKAEEAAKRAEAPMGPEARAGQVARFFERLEKNARVSAEERRLIELGKTSESLTLTDKGILVWALGTRNSKPLNKAKGARVEFEGLPIYLLRQIGFVPAFKKIPSDPKETSEANRTDVARAIMSLYLLTPASPPIKLDDASRRLGLEPQFRPPMFQPVYLLQQLALLKDYETGKRTPPTQDEARVKQLLGKLP